MGNAAEDFAVPLREAQRCKKRLSSIEPLRLKGVSVASVLRRITEVGARRRPLD